MKFRLVFLFMLLTGQTFGQKCFCDAAAKKGGGFYAGIQANGAFSTYTYNSSKEQKTSIGAGLRFGFNLSEKTSFQIGADGYTITQVTNHSAYDFSDFQILDVPMEIIFRFSNEKNGVIPFFGIGGMNHIIMKTKQYNDPEDGNSVLSGGSEYSGFYASGRAGLYFLVSDHFSLNTSFSYLYNISGKQYSGSSNLVSWKSQAGFSAGVLFHF